MGNMAELAAREKQLEAWREDLDKEERAFQAAQKKKFDALMREREKYGKKIRQKLLDTAEAAGVKNDGESFLIEEDGKRHIYSTSSWFGTVFMKNRIALFMESIGDPIVLDDEGNPANDVVWHFREWHEDIIRVLENEIKKEKQK